MKSLKRLAKRYLLSVLHVDPNLVDDDVGETLVDGIGHREYVWGLWEKIGSLQFRFMVDHGLEPQHVLLDVACGSLRAGVRFIPYLEPGNYLGIDVRQELIDAGVKIELGHKLYGLKRPEFIVSEDFEFARFSKHPDFALAQGLFTLLTDREILTCFNKLRAVAKTSTKFYATFSEGHEPRRIQIRNQQHSVYIHSRDQMLEFGKVSGWTPRYIGDWRHPRGQMMVEYSAS